MLYPITPLLYNIICSFIILFIVCSFFVYWKIVDQESLVPLEKIDCPAVMCIAAWFGDVRLIDNMEIDAPAVV